MLVILVVGARSFRMTRGKLDGFWLSEQRLTFKPADATFCLLVVTFVVTTFGDFAFTLNCLIDSLSSKQHTLPSLTFLYNYSCSQLNNKITRNVNQLVYMQTVPQRIISIAFAVSYIFRQSRKHVNSQYYAAQITPVCAWPFSFKLVSYFCFWLAKYKKQFHSILFSQGTAFHCDMSPQCQKKCVHITFSVEQTEERVGQACRNSGFQGEARIASTNVWSTERL